MNDNQINWKWVFGHTAIIWIGSFVFGFIGILSYSGFTVVDVDPYSPDMESLLGLTNILSAFLSILIIALVQKITWKHLFLVLIVLTITSFVNVIYGFSVFEIIVAGILVGIFMVIAKALAMLILKTYKVIKK